jgi:hypothetical protein
MSDMHLEFGRAYDSETEERRMSYVSSNSIAKTYVLLRDGLEQTVQLICSQVTVSKHEQC